MGNKKRYCNQIKRKIVQQYMKGETVANLHSRYSVSKVSIYKWIKTISLNENNRVPTKELEKVQKENEMLKEEVGVLKNIIYQLLKK